MLSSVYRFSNGLKTRIRERVKEKQIVNLFTKNRSAEKLRIYFRLCPVIIAPQIIDIVMYFNAIGDFLLPTHNAIHSIGVLIIGFVHSNMFLSSRERTTHLLQVHAARCMARIKEYFN